MKNEIQIKKGIIIFAAIAVFLLPLPLSQAQSLDLLPEDDGKLQELLSKNIENKIKRGTYFLLGIESRLSDSREELKMLKKNVKTLESKLSDSAVEMENLESQLTNLDRLIEENKEKIRAGELQIAEYENAILLAEEDIRQKQEEIEEEVKSLDLSINTYYLQNNLFFDSDRNSPVLLAFLSTDESTGEILKKNEYLFFLQRASQELTGRIEQNGKNLEQKKNELEHKKEKMLELQTLLAREKRTLNESQESKKRLMEETKGKQLIYEALLELSKEEEEQVSVSIERLKENYNYFQNKLDELKSNPQQSGIAFPESDDSTESEPMLQGGARFAWPVNPARGLTALFRDQEYLKAIGIPHNAIDIRLPQGSRVKAPADGVVTKVADNGFAYSYVIIGHEGNFLTLYGHLSEIFVREGEIVREGQAIGLSGGIPGTKGAGWLTTGAHLHFEVFKDFKHVDPLEYLPLEFVPVASLPEKYLNRLTGENERNKVRRAPALVEE